MAIVKQSVRKGVDLIPTCVFTSKNSEITQSTHQEIVKGISHVPDSVGSSKIHNKEDSQSDVSKRWRNETVKDVKIERDIIINTNIVNRKDVPNAKQNDAIFKTKEKTYNLKKSCDVNNTDSVTKNKETTGKIREERLSDKVTGDNCSNIKTGVVAKNEIVNNENISSKSAKILRKPTVEDAINDKPICEKNAKIDNLKDKHSSTNDGTNNNSVKTSVHLNAQENKFSKDKTSLLKTNTVQIKSNISEKMTNLEKITSKSSLTKSPDNIQNKSSPVDKASPTKNKVVNDKKSQSNKVTINKCKDKDKADTSDDKSSIKDSMMQNLSFKSSDQNKIVKNEKVSPVKGKTESFEKVSSRVNKDNLQDKSHNAENLSALKNKDNIKEKSSTDDKTQSKNKDNMNDKDITSDKISTKRKVNAQDVESTGTKMSTVKIKNVVQNKIDAGDKSPTLKSKGNAQEQMGNTKFSTEIGKTIVHEKEISNKISNIKGKDDVQNKITSAGDKISNVKGKNNLQDKSDHCDKTTKTKSKDSGQDKNTQSTAKCVKDNLQNNIEMQENKNEKLLSMKSKDSIQDSSHKSLTNDKTVDKIEAKCNDQNDDALVMKTKQNILDKTSPIDKRKDSTPKKDSSCEKLIKDEDCIQNKISNKMTVKSKDMADDQIIIKSSDHTLNKYNTKEKVVKVNHTEEMTAKFSRIAQEKGSHVDIKMKGKDSTQDKIHVSEKSLKDSAQVNVVSTDNASVKNKDLGQDKISVTEKLKSEDGVKEKTDSVAKTVTTKSKEFTENKNSSTEKLLNNKNSVQVKSGYNDGDKDNTMKKTSSEKLVTGIKNTQNNVDINKLSSEKTNDNSKDKCDVSSKQSNIKSTNKELGLDNELRKNNDCTQDNKTNKLASVQSDSVQINTHNASKVKLKDDSVQEKSKVKDKTKMKDCVQEKTGLANDKISNIKDNLQNIAIIDDKTLTIIYRSDNLEEENITKKTGTLNMLTDKTSECANSKFKDSSHDKELQNKTHPNNCDITKTGVHQDMSAVNNDVANKIKHDPDYLAEESQSVRIKNNRGNRPSSYPSIYYKNDFTALQQRSLSQQGLSTTENDSSEFMVRDCTLSAVDYAKSRFQNVNQTIKLDDIIKPKPKNTQLVTEFKSRWENNEGGGGPSLAIPLPKLNTNQKHLRGRSLSLQSENSHGVPIRPFLTKGSVAERVLLFECCPERALDRSTKSKSLLYNTWKSTTGDIQHKTRFWEISRDKASPARSIYIQKDKENVELKRSSVLNIQKSSSPLHIPQFFYPQGRPLFPSEIEAQLQEIKAAFSAFKDEKVEKEEFGIITKACNLPLYWKIPLFEAVVGSRKSYIRCSMFLEYWKRLVSIYHDEASQFVAILSRGSRKYLFPDDFITMIQDIIDTHPGLTFLKKASEFHSRYIHTVISRIYYCVNKSWSGKITVAELRKSNFLQILALLEKEEDINQITDYFSYEHFYVIYCKFWELDKDHDLFIDKYDLQRHNDGAISSKMIDRIFSGAVTQGSTFKKGKMSYTDFVWFLLSEEDKRHPRSIEYWFRCMDLDGDGYLSMYEMEYFYEEQLQRMEALGIETLPFKDCLCQMLDMIRPKVPGCISLSDLKICKMTPLFFDTFFNLEKYLDHEQRDPFASQREQDNDSCEMTDWDRYATEEYELLVAEEGTDDQSDDLTEKVEDFDINRIYEDYDINRIYEDYDQNDELSNIHKINGSSIVQRSDAATNNVNIDDDDDYDDSDITYY